MLTIILAVAAGIILGVLGLVLLLLPWLAQLLPERSRVEVSRLLLSCAAWLQGVSGAVWWVLRAGVCFLLAMLAWNELPKLSASPDAVALGLMLAIAAPVALLLTFVLMGNAPGDGLRPRQRWEKAQREISDLGKHLVAGSVRLLTFGVFVAAWVDLVARTFGGVIMGGYVAVLATGALVHWLKRRGNILAWAAQLESYRSTLIAQGHSTQVAEDVIRARAEAALRAWDAATKEGATASEIAEAVRNATNGAEIVKLMEALKASWEARPGGVEQVLKDFATQENAETKP